MKDGELATIVINLNEYKDGGANLNEWLTAFGSWTKTILKSMFGGANIPVQVRGTPDQVSAFANVLGREKRYLETWKELGLDNPMTYKRKGELDGAIRKFTSKTGIPWPFK